MAKVLGTSHVTLSAFCRENGIKTLSQNDARAIALQKMPKRRRRGTGSVAVYMAEHPEVALPQNMKQIADAIGCSHAAVRCYFSRARRQIKKMLTKLPDLRKLPADVFFETSDGGGVYPASIGSYWYELKLMSLKAVLHVRLTDGGDCLVLIDNPDAFAKRVTEASLLQDFCPHPTAQ